MLYSPSGVAGPQGALPQLGCLQHHDECRNGLAIAFTKPFAKPGAFTRPVAFAKSSIAFTKPFAKPGAVNEQL